MPCNQKGPPPCPEPAVFRFTWPGDPEKRICAKHAIQLQGIATAMGFALQMITLTYAEWLDDLERKEEDPCDTE